jgi:hypothetical protein
MFLFEPQLRFSHFICKLRFLLRYVNCGFLSLVNNFVNDVTSLILGHLMLTGLSGHLWLSYKTKTDTFPSLLLRRKAFPFRLLHLPQLPYSYSVLRYRISSFRHTIYTYFPHLCFNLTSWTWWHLFHFTFRPPYLNIFPLVLTIRHIVTVHSHAFCFMQPNSIFLNFILTPLLKIFIYFPIRLS